MSLGSRHVILSFALGISASRERVVVVATRKISVSAEVIAAKDRAAFI